MEEKYKLSVNHNYTFDAFIEGDCNRVARRAGKTVAEKPGANSFNPLVIYGGVCLFFVLWAGLRVWHVIGVAHLRWVCVSCIILTACLNIM
jgi:hypothetical protein